MRRSPECAYSEAMTTPKFRVVPVQTKIAEAARTAAEAGASDHAIVTADSSGGYPCRHCLRWAEPGERLILFPFASVPPGRPYSETGPIFVHATPCERYRATKEYPAAFREGRVVRAYNSGHDMIAAEVANGAGPEDLIERFLQRPETAFIHVRSVSRGCYTMGIERL
jgi:Protein of unknown function (DUF1203)